MNETITTPEELIDEVELQALQELDECLDTLSVAYEEYSLDKKDKELKELYLDAVNDLKTLIGDYVSEDDSLIQEAYELLFENIKQD